MTVRSPLSTEDAATYNEQGLLLQRAILSEDEIKTLEGAIDEEYSIDSDRLTREEGTGVPYRAHGSHLHNQTIARLVRLSRFLDTARQLLDDEVYVHQLKIHKKRPFQGGIWKWHQDFMFWNSEDHMPRPEALTVALCLDEVTEFNGPMIFIPHGHEYGIFAAEAKSEGWSQTVTSNLKYSLDDSEEMRLAALKNGLVAPKGPPGSAIWFHCNMPHASAQNMSPINRTVILISYNAVSNALPSQSIRPEWLAGRDFSPLEVWEGGLAGEN